MCWKVSNTHVSAIDELVTTDDTTTIIFCAYQREATSRRDATWRIDLGRVILQRSGRLYYFSVMEILYFEVLQFSKLGGKANLRIFCSIFIFALRDSFAITTTFMK